MKTFKNLIISIFFLLRGMSVYSWFLISDGSEGALAPIQFPGTPLFLGDQQELFGWALAACCIMNGLNFILITLKRTIIISSPNFKNRVSPTWHYGHLGSMVLCSSLVLCCVECTAALLGPTHQMPDAPLPEPPFFQTLPHVPWEKIVPGLRAMALRNLKS